MFPRSYAWPPRPLRNHCLNGCLTMRALWRMIKHMRIAHTLNDFAGGLQSIA